MDPLALERAYLKMVFVLNRGIFAVFLFGALTGCADLRDVEEARQLIAPPVGVAPPSSDLSLAGGSRLHRLALQLDKVAIKRSSAIRELHAAQARLLARRYDRFPQIRPTGSVAVKGDREASIGISLEQVIWDAGRTRARLNDDELKVALAALQAWEERNMVIYEGLRALVDMSRYQSRLRAYRQLRDEFDTLAVLLEARAAGGVSDRGELLRMNVARQELQRNRVTNEALLRQGRRDLLRFLPEHADVPPLSDLAAASAQCRRTWPASEAPLNALARLRVNRARRAQDRIRAQWFPRIILDAGVAAVNTAGLSTPGVAIRLDAEDMLGLRGKRVVEAAVLDTQAAWATYETQRQDVAADFARLDANHVELVAGLRQLRALQQSSTDMVTLYREQLGAGSLPLTAGIALFREVTNTLIDMIDFHADDLINCLQASQLRGLLAPFEVRALPGLNETAFAASRPRLERERSQTYIDDSRKCCNDDND